MSEDMRRKFLAVVLVGLVARYVLGILYTYPTDINYWMVVMENLSSGESLYSLPGYYYTPVWGYFLALMTMLFQFLGIPLGEYAPELVNNGHMVQDWNCVMPSIEFALVLKTFLFIVDLLVMVVVYRIGCMVSDERKAFIAASVWFLCPFTILISSVRIMFENIEILFMLLALYAMLSKHPVEAGILVAVSILVKPYAVFLAILMIGFAYAQSRSFKYTGGYVLAAVVMGIAIMLPVFLEGDFAESLKWLHNQSPGQAVGSQYNLVAYITPILLVVSAVFAAVFAKKGVTDGNVLITATLIITSCMLIIPGNIQYYLILLPLIMLAPFPHKGIVLFVFLLLALFAFLSYNDWSAALYIHYAYPGAGVLDSFSRACSDLSMRIGYNPVKSLAAVLAIALPLVTTAARRRCGNAQ